MSNLVEIFCNVDDFCMQFCPQWEGQLIADGIKKRNRHSKMTISEKMTIVIAFHQSNHRDFKNFYIGLVQRYWSTDFPNALSYNRFIKSDVDINCTYALISKHLKARPQASPSLIQQALK